MDSGSINLVFTGKCFDCPCADLKLGRMEYSVDGGDKVHWSVSCVNRRMCDEVEERLRKRMLGDE